MRSWLRVIVLSNHLLVSLMNWSSKRSPKLEPKRHNQEQQPSLRKIPLLRKNRLRSLKERWNRLWKTTSKFPRSQRKSKKIHQLSKRQFVHTAQRPSPSLKVWAATWARRTQVWAWPTLRKWKLARNELQQDNCSRRPRTCSNRRTINLTSKKIDQFWTHSKICSLRAATQMNSYWNWSIDEYSIFFRYKGFWGFGEVGGQS